MRGRNKMRRWMRREGIMKGGEAVGKGERGIR
jgi:hypothetical protein